MDSSSAEMSVALWLVIDTLASLAELITHHLQLAVPLDLAPALISMIHTSTLSINSISFHITLLFGFMALASMSDALIF